ncbi:phosphoribosylglycinamide formyltransferase [Marinicella meishanensis]|uniref:phosphoribosylglycinamide formyltransferase n=1 Tax=Marinicella meishanensis TaxID=2873263 RepID=UPI001CBFCF6B|nr:phosphoribosylglycinamide formyltransferase [Marinicella sp. NBU2979]
MRVAVLISGRGSNLAALINHQHGYAIEHVISNNPYAAGLQLARDHGITNTYLNWSNRERAEHMLGELLQQLAVDLVVLAGFMRILSAELVHRFAGKIINIHPSLLPKYPGLNTHQKVLDHQDPWHGATVHLVDEHLDQGPSLAQTTIAVQAGDDANALADRLILQEHKLLTTVVGLIAQGDLIWTDDEVRYHGQTMTQPLMIE